MLLLKNGAAVCLLAEGLLEHLLLVGSHLLLLLLDGHILRGYVLGFDAKRAQVHGTARDHGVLRQRRVLHVVRRDRLGHEVRARLLVILVAGYNFLFMLVSDIVLIPCRVRRPGAATVLLLRGHALGLHLGLPAVVVR